MWRYNEEIFKDQSYVDLLSGTKTPKFNGEPKRTGYVFTGWTPEVTETVTQTGTDFLHWRLMKMETTNQTKAITTSTIRTTPLQRQISQIRAVKTGDSTNVLLWSMATIISLTGSDNPAPIFKRRDSR
ncbi:MAG: hypothetical protein V8S14_03090 [Lachnospiraceae bacterium]